MCTFLVEGPGFSDGSSPKEQPFRTKLTTGGGEGGGANGNFFRLAVDPLSPHNMHLTLIPHYTTYNQFLLCHFILAKSSSLLIFFLLIDRGPFFRLAVDLPLDITWTLRSFHIILLTINSYFAIFFLQTIVQFTSHFQYVFINWWGPLFGGGPCARAHVAHAKIRP